MAFFRSAKLGILIILMSMAYVAAKRDSKQSPDNCPIGERPNSTNNPCDGGDRGCQNDCTVRFGGPVNGVCKARGNNGRSECICLPACKVASSWGDVHVNTFDDADIAYNGLCRHILVNATGTADFPAFIIVGKNQPFESEVMTIPEHVELLIPSWNIEVKIGKLVEVDSLKVDAPFRWYSRISDSRKENFVSIEKISHGTGKDAVKGFRVSTSFGVLIQKEDSAEIKAQQPAFAVFVYLPEIPNFRGKVNGLMGNFDGNSTNDYCDAFGRQRGTSLMDGWFIGDSYCLDPTEITNEKTVAAYIRQHNHRLNSCNRHAEKSRSMNRCQKIDRSDVRGCVGEENAKKLVQDCEIDLCYANERDEDRLLCNAFSVVAHRCDVALDCNA